MYTVVIIEDDPMITRLNRRYVEQDSRFAVVFPTIEINRSPASPNIHRGRRGSSPQQKEPAKKILKGVNEMIGKLFKLLLGILLLPFLFAAGVVLSLMVLFSVMGFTGIVFGLLLTIACIALAGALFVAPVAVFFKAFRNKKKA